MTPAVPLLAAAGIVLTLACLPLLFSPELPLIDMPAHLARLEIIDQVLAGGPLAEFYSFEPGLVPNLLFDGVGWALLQAVPLDLAGSLYLVLALAGQLFGTVFLHRALLGHYSYWPLTAALLLYNLSFFYGFLGYLAGVGLALLFLAMWIALRDRPAALRLAAGSAAAMVLFLAHIVPLIVYASAVAGYELQAAAALRRRPAAALGRLIVGAAQFVAPAILFLGKTPTAGLAHETADLRWATKIGSVVATPTAGSAGIDGYTLAAALLVLLVPLAFRVRLARAFAAALAGAILAFAAMPWAMGPVVNLDIRMPLAILLMIIAATDLTVRRAGLAVALAGVVAALLIARVAGVSIQADRFSARLDAYRAAFQDLPPGAVLFTAINDRCPRPPSPPGACAETDSAPPASLLEAPRWLLVPEIYLTRLATPRHVAALASIDRDVFVPQIFATRGLQPIAVRPPFAELKALQGDDPIVIRTDEQMRTATARLVAASQAALRGRPVFLLMQRIEGGADLAAGGAEVVGRGPQFTLYRLASTPAP